MGAGAIAGLAIGVGILCLLIGAALGYWFAMKTFKKQLKENPPITESQIRSMYKQMGRTPNEKQVKQIMETFKKNTK